MEKVRIRPLTWLRRAATFVALLWLAHALAFFVHEYAHSFTAWAFGCKSNPLALAYGRLDIANLLIQSDIDENVDYGPIFAAHRGGAAALIAVAGVLFGNGLFYLASQFGYRAARRAGHRTLALFCFLLVVMNVGNFLSYVPIRTFATHADMATVERGLGISPWWLILFPGAVFCLAVMHLLAVGLPDALRYFPASQAERMLLLLVCCGSLFGFYGSSGFFEYGPIALALSQLCLWVLLPLSVGFVWLRMRRVEMVV